MPKIQRKLDTPEARDFWKSADEDAKRVGEWPAWKRAGINVAERREATANDESPPSDDSGQPESPPRNG
jgi:hypothetical protein